MRVEEWRPRHPLTPSVCAAERKSFSGQRKQRWEGELRRRERLSPCEPTAHKLHFLPKWSRSAAACGAGDAGGRKRVFLKGPRCGPELQGTPNMGQTAGSAVSQAASGECQ